MNLKWNANDNNEEKRKKIMLNFSFSPQHLYTYFVRVAISVSVLFHSYYSLFFAFRYLLLLFILAAKFRLIITKSELFILLFDWCILYLFHSPQSMSVDIFFLFPFLWYIFLPFPFFLFLVKNSVFRYNSSFSFP